MASRDWMALQDFTGKTALVTGAASGIGQACASLLAARGARVVLVDIDFSAATGVAARLGPEHLPLRADLSCDEDVEWAAEAALAVTKRIDILVNNAGITDGARPTLQQTRETWDRVMAVNLAGPYRMMRALAPAMIGQGGGVVVNISSIAGLVGVPLRTAYSVSKAGIAMLTRVLACEWASHGIRINAVAPGYVRTALVESLIAEGRIDPAEIERRTPMGRFAQEAEIAKAIAFLASDDASYITGVTLPVDGGYTAFGGAFDAAGEHSPYAGHEVERA